MLLLLFFRVCLGLRAFASLNLAIMFFFPWSRRCRFHHGPCAGLVLRRSAWYRGALSGIVALCLACVSVVVIVNSYVLVRIFHLGLWGGPLLFIRKPAELQSPMEVTTPPAQLFHCHSACSIEEQPTPPSLTLLPVGRAVVASGEEELSHLPAVLSALGRGGHPLGERWSRCVGRHLSPN